MNESIDWIDVEYNKVYQEELRGLTRRREHDKTLTIEELQGILDSLYIIDGNDQDGRGALGDTTVSAQIAAYEHFIHQWLAEKDTSNSK